MCYKSRCQSGQIVLEINGQSYKCQSSGQQINPSGVEGYVTCPDINKFCMQYEQSCTDDCNLNGRCLKGGKCYCYPGYMGTTCGEVDPSAPAVSFTSNSGDRNGNGSSYDCPDNCMNRGRCINGVCSCIRGFTGRACASIDIIGLFSGGSSGIIHVFSAITAIVAGFFIL